MKKWSRTLMSLVIGLTLVGSIVAGGENKTNRNKRAQKALEIKVAPWGPTQADVDAARLRAEQSAVVRSLLKGAKYRFLSFEYVDTAEADKSLPSRVPTHFRVVFYNYSNDRAIIAEGDFAGRESITVTEGLFDPGVSGDELEAAFKVIRDDPEFAGPKNQNRFELSEAMPPVSNLNGERLVNIGVRNLEDGSNQIVGVSFKNEKVVRYADNAPPTVRATPEACGIPSAGQGSTGPGNAGQYQMTVMQDNLPLWEMLIIRPSSSSGASSERSGIEVRDVKYKGKSVLKRGHAPILNVKYLPGGNCNAFRDWQYAEGFFNVPEAGTTYPGTPGGTGGGIALLAEGQIATTSVESGVDLGNFRGVAIYQQDVGYGNEIVMVSEMNAGWYRYIMEWRFAPDGTIRPRYGFGSITNSCVCSPRNHHVYWRFDFDIVQPNNKVFKVERGRKFLTPVTTEAAIFRSYQLNRSFLVQNSDGDEAYQITPGPNDQEAYFTNPGGSVETYGHGDFWLLQFKGTANSPDELNDPNTSSAANINPWVNNESLADQDVVVWYGAHQFRQDDSSLTTNNKNNVLTGVHVVGPDLRPVRW